MFVIARRSSSNPNVLRFLMDKSVGQGNSTAGVQVFSRDNARKVLKTRQRDGYFLLDIPSLASVGGKLVLRTASKSSKKPSKKAGKKA
jgi:hypothetical protein